MTLVGLLYPESDKSETVCTNYKVQSTKDLNLLKENECRILVQIVLCNFFLYINNIKKYYLVSLCVISIIIMFAPIDTKNSSIISWQVMFFKCEKFRMEKSSMINIAACKVV